MIARGTEAITRARTEGWALGAYSVYNLELARAVCEAAERSRGRLIVQTGISAFNHAGGAALRALVVRSAEESAADVGVHLDHARGLEDVRACLEAGYSSVMIDGSALPLEKNIALTREAVALAHGDGAWVEGELAGIAGDEDRSSNANPVSFTDPETAELFVEKTGVDALAVAIGNVHGLTDEPVQLDLDRLKEISERVEVPLVLHGASGLVEAQLRDAIALGVAKINMNTELRVIFLRTLRTTLMSAPELDDLAALYRPAILAARDHVETRQRLLTAAVRSTV